MTLETWLRERRPAPPARLIDRMCSAARESQQSTSADLAGGARIASLYLLQMILAEKNSSRTAAVDLLAADALMTCSCEAACERPETLGHEADRSTEDVLAIYKAARDAAAGSG